MSRVAKNPISIPKNVDVKLEGKRLIVKGTNGEIAFHVHEQVGVTFENNAIQVKWDDAVVGAKALAGTTRAVVNNMVTGVTAGFMKKLSLVGVGYRAQAKGKVLNLTLGFSHPVDYEVPEGITIETPSQTEIVVKGIDKQKVGQVAAEIRAYRAPEPYKGKGVRYSDEQVVRKDAKKK